MVYLKIAFLRLCPSHKTICGMIGEGSPNKQYTEACSVLTAVVMLLAAVVAAVMIHSARKDKGLAAEARPVGSAVHPAVVVGAVKSVVSVTVARKRI